jgi:hypothetical protein
VTACGERTRPVCKATARVGTGVYSFRCPRLGLATAVVLLVLAAPAQAARVYQVQADNVYVRNKILGVVIGTTYPGEQVVVQRRSKGWGYGAVHGSFAGVAGRPCGWVQLAHSKTHYLRDTGTNAAAECPAHAPELRESRLFQPGSYFSHIGTGATWMARVAPCDSPTAWGNYNPATGRFDHLYGVMPVGRGFDVDGFGMRYRTHDGVAVMVKDASNPVGAPNWFFMYTGCLEVPPVYIGMRHEIDDPSLPLIPGGTPSVRPKRVYKSASMGYYYNSAARLRWRWWGPPQTRANGVGRFNKCFPCAANRYATRPGAHVVLSHRVPGTCKGSTAVFYTRAEVTLPHYKGPHWVRAIGGRYNVRLLPTCG